jgi:cell division inhibitor SulA
MKFKGIIVIHLGIINILSTMAKTNRKLKLQPEHSPRAYNQCRIVPSLKLSGIWLEQSGFNVGETVQVTVKEGELTIKTQ